MNLKDYQQEVKRTLPDLGSQSLNLAHMVFGMNSEYVEIYNATDDVNLSEEYCDILWYACNYCNMHNIDLYRIFTFGGYFKIAQNDDYNQQLQCAIAELTDLEKKRLAYKKVFERSEIINSIVKVVEKLNDCFTFNNLDPEEAMQKNIDKLKIRYPEKFSEQRALNRNLEKEREVLM